MEGQGASVYIDKVDPQMPPYTNSVTAEKLKERITLSKKFVLLATKNSKDSKWVPWELGFADGKKAIKNIAIFPAVDEQFDTDWTSWEYMGLYQRIIWGDFNGDGNLLWIVLNEEKNTGIPLREWLTS